MKFGPRVYGENLPTTLTEQTHTGEKDENNDGRYDDCEVVDKADGEGGYGNDGQDGGKDDVVGVGDVEWLILCCLLSCGVMVMDKH